MTLYRYRAVALAPSPAASVSAGEMSGETAAEIRSRLRAGGLQVLDLGPVRRLTMPRIAVGSAIVRAVERHLRARRHAHKEELLDGLATLIEAGVPLLESIETLLSGGSQRHAGMRRLLLDVSDRIRAGESLASALGSQRSWFDEVEVALVDAGEYAGTLTSALKKLAARQRRRSQIGEKVAGALIYPSVVAVVGIGVWVFLATKTLPELVALLRSADIEVPALTRAVIASGGALAAHPLLVLAGIAGVAAVALVGVPRLLARRTKAGTRSPRWPVGFAALRRTKLAQVAGTLAELLDGGVPLVEALRAVAPSAGSTALRSALLDSARQIEAGQNWSQTLGDERWFPAEFRRLVEMGESSGELSVLLERVSARMERSAERRITQLAALLEPAAILTLALLIGLLVAAAVIPILRLQDLV